MDVLVCESHDGQPQQIVGVLVELRQSNRRPVARAVDGCVNIENLAASLSCLDMASEIGNLTLQYLHETL